MLQLCNCTPTFLFAAGVSSIPIVDDNDSLVDIYCRRYDDKFLLDVFHSTFLLLILAPLSIIFLDF